VDAPAHFLSGGKRLDAFPPDRFLLDALVVDVPGKDHVRGEDFDLEGVAPGQAVLFRTDNSASGKVAQAKFTRDFLALTPSAAHKCVEAAVGLVGIDAPSIDPADSGPEAHRILLGKEILLLEGADLRRIEPGRYRLICLPLRIHLAEGSPVRAVLTEV
jgi:arylformamidase